MTFGSDGNLYVLNNHPGSDEVLRFNGTTGNFLGVFAAGLTVPHDLAFGPDGHLYVANADADTISRFDSSNGAPLGNFVTARSGGLHAPTGFVFGPDGHLYVASFFTDSVLRYNGSTRAFIDAFVPTGSGSLSGPNDLTFGADRNLYVSSQSQVNIPGGVAGEVLRFDGKTGTFVDSFVTPGSGDLGLPNRGLLFTDLSVSHVPGWNIDSNGNWSASANWSGGIPNGTSARATFGSIITQPRVVTVNTPITVAQIDFDNAKSYTIGGSNPLTLENATGDAQISVLSGSHTIAAPLTLATDTVATVLPAGSNLSITALATSGVTLTKAGSGTLTVNNIRAAGLILSEGKVAVALNGSAAGTSVVGELSIAGGATPTAKLDLTNNAAVVDYTGDSPAARIRQQILAGRGGSGLGQTWNGPGITSSTAAAAEAETRSIGYAENSELPLGAYTNFRGQPMDDTAVIMAFTPTGDANLDGVVNDLDVTIVSAAYAPDVPQPFWALGDFDYNGFVDDADVTLLGVFYDPGAPPLAVPIGESVVALPEPSGIALGTVLLGTLTIGTIARRRITRRR
jgi:hypothetical protein